jgi:GTP pyrophosphokinase
MYSALFESAMSFDSGKERQAWRVAKRKHDDTKVERKASKEPYFVHPEGTAMIAKAYGFPSKIVQACLLHDTAEDTGATIDDLAEKFGAEVAEIVSEVTNDASEVLRLGKENYINHELENLTSDALSVKLLDMLANTMDRPKESQKARMRKNVEYLLSHRDDLTNLQSEVAEEILSL